MDEYVFISDLHLDDNHPEQLQAFIEFVATLRAGQQLFILGDLFNVWFGDDTTLAATTVIAELCSLQARGVAIFIMPGNRDFLVDSAFASSCGAQLLPDPYILEIQGQPVILTHGDAMCTLDVAYQQFKRRMQSPFIHKLNKTLPVSWKRCIAKLLRKLSSRSVKHKTMQIMDVHLPAVEACFVQHGADLMIHGHTHRPAQHNHMVNNVNRLRYVLGAWDLKPVVLRVIEGEFRLGAPA